MLRRKLIVATEAYRKAFKAPAAEVRLQARPRLAINSVDDLKTLADGVSVCLTVTHVDGLVLARSAFHHSINYRSVVVFGTATEVSGDEKEHGLFVISEQVLKGRWDESRTPTKKELQATSVLKLTIDSASAKVRTGGPKDEEDDYSLPIWAGVVPIYQTFGPVEADPKLAAGIPVPASVETLLRRDN